jgi:hypothetical protein
MNDLSDEARALFQAARGAHEPTESERAQVHRATLTRVGALAAGVTLTRSAAASSKLALALKVGVGLVVAASIGGGGYLALRSLSEPPKSAASAVAHGSAPVRGVPSAAGPQASDPERDSGPPLIARAEPSGPVAKARGKSEVPSAHGSGTLSAERAPNPSRASFTTPAPSPTHELPASADTPESREPSDTTLSREAQGLAAVQRALRGSRAAEALALLDDQERQFPSGKLGQERQAARVIALCALGKVSAARSLAARFLAQQPNSPVAARLRNSCAGP